MFLNSKIPNKGVELLVPEHLLWINHAKGVAVAKWSKAPDWDFRSKIVGSIPAHAIKFSTLNCKENPQGTLNQGNNNIL